MDEVGNIRPEHIVFRRKVKSWPQTFGLHGAPDFSNPFGQKFAFFALIMHTGLKLVERNLAHNGVEHILHLASQQQLAAHGVFLPIQQGLEGQHLTEHAGGFSQCQRCVGHQIPLPGSQNLMHTMPKFMRQRHHIADAAMVVEQNIRVGRGHRGVGKRTGGFAGGRRHINPRVGQEGGYDLAHARVKPIIRFLYNVLGFGPWNFTVLTTGQRGVAVPVLQLVQPHPFGFKAIIPVGQTRIIGPNGRNQRVHHAIFHHVGQIAR